MVTESAAREESTSHKQTEDQPYLNSISTGVMSVSHHHLSLGIEEYSNYENHY